MNIKRCFSFVFLLVGCTCIQHKSTRSLCAIAGFCRSVLTYRVLVLHHQRSGCTRKGFLNISPEYFCIFMPFSFLSPKPQSQGTSQAATLWQIIYYFGENSQTLNPRFPRRLFFSIFFPSVLVAGRTAQPSFDCVEALNGLNGKRKSWQTIKMSTTEGKCLH